jgi:hypothetical protein
MSRLLVSDPVNVIPAKVVPKFNHVVAKKQEEYHYPHLPRITNREDEKQTQDTLKTTEQPTVKTTPPIQKVTEEFCPFRNQTSPIVKQSPWSGKIKGFSIKKSINDKVTKDTEDDRWIGEEELIPDVLRSSKKKEIRQTESQEDGDIKTITIRSRPTKGRSQDFEESIEDLNAYTVQQLKDMCKEQGLPTNGKKAELVARLS